MGPYMGSPIGGTKEGPKRDPQDPRKWKDVGGIA